MAQNIIKRGSFEEKIYKKCDGQNSIADIVQVTGKSAEYVGSVLSRLRQKGLIKNTQKER